MPRPFEALSETLLKAGIAPRHVRRYTRELEEHLDDLVRMQTARGYDGEDAVIRARALLGPDEELAEAMLHCPQFRSLMARAPWLVFGVVPPLILFGLLAGVGLMMLGVWALLPGYHHAPPVWLGDIARTWGTVANFAAGPLAAVYFVVIAINQRQSWHWPAVAVATTALFSAFTIFVVRLPDKGRLGEIGVGLGATDATLWQNFVRFGLTLAVVIASYAIARRQSRTLA